MSNVDAIKGRYEAFARQDIPEVLSRFDENIKWTSPDSLPTGGTFHGHAGVLSFFAALPTYYDELRVEVDSYLEAGDLVIARGHHRGSIAKQSFEAPFAHVWTMRNGLAVEFFEYADTAPVARLLDSRAQAAR